MRPSVKIAILALATFLSLAGWRGINALLGRDAPRTSSFSSGGQAMPNKVKKTDKEWKGPVGLVTKLLENIDVPMDDAFAIVCGPPVMFKFVCNMLGKMGMPRDRMFVSLERRMHCGMGKCCRCNVGSTYVCMNGPVFDFWTVMNLKEAI